jgi:uncharacterized protein YerC
MAKQKAKILDAVLEGNIEWATAREAAYRMANHLQNEVDNLTEVSKDAYSPMAWISICRQLRIVTDGMTVMRLVGEGKTNEQITNETGIVVGSIAAYKAWNTMYRAFIEKGLRKRVALKGRTDTERSADAEFLRSCGIAIAVEGAAHE